MNKKFVWAKLIVLSFVLVSLVSCQSDNQNYILTENDLKDCSLFINNMTCSSRHELRTVEDEDYRDEVASLLMEMTPFRPIISSDIILGDDQEVAVAIFKNEEVQYTISFGDAEKQLSLDYIYRDAPIATVAKAELGDEGQPRNIQEWFCTMSAADYAAAFEMVRTYSGGEIVN